METEEIAVEAGDAHSLLEPDEIARVYAFVDGSPTKRSLLKGSVDGDTFLDTFLVLDNEEMQRLGGEEHGYEQVRQPTSSAVDFMHRFPLDMCFPIDSTEHTEWLAAAGTI